MQTGEWTSKALCMAVLPRWSIWLMSKPGPRVLNSALIAVASPACANLRSRSAEAPCPATPITTLEASSKQSSASAAVRAHIVLCMFLCWQQENKQKRFVYNFFITAQLHQVWIAGRKDYNHIQGAAPTTVCLFVCFKYLLGSENS